MHGESQMSLSCRIVSDIPWSQACPLKSFNDHDCLQAQCKLRNYILYFRINGRHNGFSTSAYEVGLGDLFPLYWLAFPKNKYLAIIVIV